MALLLLVPASALEPEDAPIDWATYLGGSEWEFIRDMAATPDGGLVVVGSTESPDHPVTLDAAQLLWGGYGSESLVPLPNRRSDGFVSKLDGDGGLAWSTFLGGASVDSAQAVAVDSAGRIAVTGHTQSTTFPTTPGAHQSEHAGDVDAFVAVYEADGTLAWSTLLGGGDHGAGEPAYFSRDIAAAVAFAPDGGVVVAGGTRSHDFPVTPGAVAYHAGEPQVKAFVTKFDADGGLAWSGTLGGSPTYLGEGDSEAFSLAIDDAGRVLVAGRSTAPDFPTTPDTFQPVHAGVINPLPELADKRYADAFLTWLSPDGSSVEASTFFGGAHAVEVRLDDGRLFGIIQPAEAIRDVALGPGGDVFAVGDAPALDLPGVTGASAQATLGDDPETSPLLRGDGFALRISSDLSTLRYATYIGGEASENMQQLMVDDNGRLHALGRSRSWAFPVDEAAWQDQTEDERDYQAYEALLCQTVWDSIEHELMHVNRHVCENRAAAISARSVAGVYVVLSPDGSEFESSTYIDGDNEDYEGGIARLSDGRLALAWSTAGRDLPVRDAIQPVNRGGFDGHVMVVGAGGGCDMVVAHACFLMPSALPA